MKMCQDTAPVPTASRVCQAQSAHKMQQSEDIDSREKTLDSMAKDPISLQADTAEKENDKYIYISMGRKVPLSIHILVGLNLLLHMP